MKSFGREHSFDLAIRTSHYYMYIALSKLSEDSRAESVYITPTRRSSIQSINHMRNI